MPKFSKTDAARLNGYVSELQEMCEQIETLKDSKQEIYDNRSEKWQESEKGQEAQELIDALDTAYNDIDGIVTSLSDLLGDDLEG